VLPSRTTTDTRVIVLAAAALAFAVPLFAPAVLNDGDTYWHIAAGQWMLDNQAVLRIDPFSYTFAGHPWQTHEWLGEIVMALAYLGAGWSGITLLFGAAAALTAGLLAYHLSRWLHGLGLIVTLVLSLTCVAGSLLARPHLLALPLLELWVAELVMARADARGPSWKLLALMMLWANLHASFLIGLILVVPFAVDAVLDDPATRGAAAKRWGGFMAAAFVAALITPYGISGLTFPFRLMAIPSLQAVLEWAPTDLQTPQPLTFAVAAALYVLLTRGAKVKPISVAVLLGLLYLALAHARHQTLIAIAAPLILAEPLGAVLASRQPMDVRVSPQLPVMAFGVLVALMASLRLAIPLERQDGATTPASALAHVPASLARRPVLNDYAFGGYLIFEDVRPFIDSRVELYGENFIYRYRRMIAPDKALLESTLDKYHIRWTILAANNPAAEAMDGMAGWHRLYADRWAVVHVKDDAQ
jgi:hypothetical protein